MTRIIRQLLDFARQSKARKERCDLVHLVGQTLPMLEPMAQKKALVVAREPAEGPVIAVVDAGQIQQVVTNLVVNAIQAAERGRITIACRYATGRHPDHPAEGDRDHAVIAVSDEGPGIDDALLPTIFDPFVTTKEVGEGTGLGLAVSHGIVEEHGGGIDVVTQLGKGSTFTVYVPRRDESGGEDG